MEFRASKAIIEEAMKLIFPLAQKAEEEHRAYFKAQRDSHLQAIREKSH